MTRWMLALATLIAPLAAQAQDDDYGWPEKAFGDWRVYRHITGCWIVNDTIPGGSELSLKTSNFDTDLYVDFINYDWPWKSKANPTMQIRFGSVSLTGEVLRMDVDDSDYSVLFDAPEDSYIGALKAAPSFHVDLGEGHATDVPLAASREAFAYFEQCTLDLRKKK